VVVIVVVVVVGHDGENFYSLCSLYQSEVIGGGGRKNKAGEGRKVVEWV
jgi:hypothetical protein